MSNAPLATLCDIHLPAPIVWWPPAPGWFIVAGILLLFCITGSFLMRRWYHKRGLRHQVMRTFLQLKQSYTQQHDNAAFATLNQLLKQVALTYHPKRHPEKLMGPSWLTFLNTTGKTQQFSEPCGKQLIHAAYSTEPVDDAEKLFRYCEQWLREQL